eukprot:TRINITY_DN33250_c0_g1_i1.p1 TRINITY_DN33250_c0_g1~~TRINITY_DN33250_c0_g1_i1.p1  ORF type:complete len:291 (+),score=27.61 TRINITY_DN33250_c0_g1_i1:26-874(+)
MVSRKIPATQEIGERFEFVSNGSKTVVLLNGGCLLEFIPSGKKENVLFLSSKAILNNLKKSPRGGIPVVFPQFGDGPLPKHGFVRNMLWKHEEEKDTASSFTISVCDTKESRKIWDFAFKLAITYTVLASELNADVNIQMDEVEPFSILLHPYFRVSRPENAIIRVSGLQSDTLSYYCKVDGSQLNMDLKNGTAIQEIDGSEIDRVFRNCENGATVEWKGESHTSVEYTGFKDLVCWNIGRNKAAGLADLGEDEDLDYVCVEPGTLYDRATAPFKAQLSIKV